MLQMALIKYKETWRVRRRCKASVSINLESISSSQTRASHLRSNVSKAVLWVPKLRYQVQASITRRTLGWKLEALQAPGIKAKVRWLFSRIRPLFHRTTMFSAMKKTNEEILFDRKTLNRCTQVSKMTRLAPVSTKFQSEKRQKVQLSGSSLKCQMKRY